MSFGPAGHSSTFAGMYSIRQCLEIMHSGAVFSMKVVSWDERRRDRCGKVLEYPEAVLVWGNLKTSRGPGREKERDLTSLEAALLGAGAGVDRIRRNPQHALHYTRNIRVLVDGRPTEVVRKAHPILIIEFNGKKTTP